MNIIELAKQVGYPIQHEEWRKATEAFAALVEAAARADEREECLADVKKVFNTFESFPQSPEIKLIRSFTSIFLKQLIKQSAQGEQHDRLLLRSMR